MTDLKTSEDTKITRNTIVNFLSKKAKNQKKKFGVYSGYSGNARKGDSGGYYHEQLGLQYGRIKAFQHLRYY